MPDSLHALVLDRPAPDEHPPYAATYVAAAPPQLGTALATQGDALARLLAPLDDEAARRRYAPGKWSVKEVVGHLADTERIMAYRLLRIARGDATPLPGFDEDAYVAAGAFDARTLPELVDDFRAARAATCALVRGLAPSAWPRRGAMSGAPVSARALGFILVGHVAHHVRILQERYGIAPAVAVDARD